MALFAKEPYISAKEPYISAKGLYILHWSKNEEERVGLAQHTATHCNILQHTATQLQHNCNTLHHTAIV